MTIARSEDINKDDTSILNLLKKTFSFRKHFGIGIFNSPNYDVNPQPNTQGIGPLVGRTSGNRRCVMHV